MKLARKMEEEAVGGIQTPECTFALSIAAEYNLECWKLD